MDTVDVCICNFIKYFPEVFDTACTDKLVDFVHGMLCGMDSSTNVVHNDICARVETIRKARSQLATLLATPQVAQRSEEWYEMRRGRLTASAVAQAIGQGKYGTRSALVRSKAFPELDEPFNSFGCPPLRHGIILEDMSARCYSQRMNNIKIHNFGLIPHPTLSCFGASPDGINELGIMVEIKTPYKREVNGVIPDEYMLQMQGQMAVCGLDECDFVDATIKMSDQLDTYFEEVASNKTVDHGIIVEYKDENGQPCFDYSPPHLTPMDCLKWANNTKKERTTHQRSQCLLAWRLEKICIKRVKFNQELWDSLVPEIQAFWDDVCTTRREGIQNAILSMPVKKQRAKKEKDTLLTSSPPKSYAFIDDESDGEA